MSIYHCSFKMFSRSKGHTAISKAAYRSATKLHDDEIGKTTDYTRKRGVIYSEIMLCDNAPKEYSDRETLWNAVQKVEKQSNAQLAREIEVAFPNEFTPEQRIDIIKEYIKKNFTDEGMIADFSIHDKESGKKGNPNPHCHIMLTTRPIKENGEWGAKEKKVYKLDDEGNKIPIIDEETGEQKIGPRGRRMWAREYAEVNDWNSQTKADIWRKSWADICNQYLDEEHKIDHRSNKERGINKIPTVHEGYAARQMEAEGNVSELCEINREIKKTNEEIDKIEEEIKELVQESNWINNLRNAIEELRLLWNQWREKEDKYYDLSDNWFNKSKKESLQNEINKLKTVYENTKNKLIEKFSQFFDYYIDWAGSKSGQYAADYNDKDNTINTPNHMNKYLNSDFIEDLEYDIEMGNTDNLIGIDDDIDEAINIGKTITKNITKTKEKEPER